MNGVRECPVCGSAQGQTGGDACPQCGFSLAFSRYFAGRGALSRHRARTDERRAAWLEEKRRRFASGTAFVLGEKCLVCRLPGGTGLVRLDTEGNREDFPDAVQYSASRGHELFLMADGTVRAAGDNRLGQGNVTDLRDIAFILAGPNVSYFVGRDGRVDAKGACPFLESIRGWRGVRALAAGDHHLAALTGEGTVLFAGALNAPDIFHHPCAWNGIRSIAAANDYVLGLGGDGKVRFAGYPDDTARRETEQWTDITAVAAENIYAVGLTRTGQVLLAGEGGFLDRGRSRARTWTHILAITGGYGIGGITEDGALRLEGGFFSLIPPDTGPLYQSWIAARGALEL